MLPTPVKLFAEAKGLSVDAPERLKDSQSYEHVQSLEPDLFVVASYGKFIPSAWLSIPKKLSINVHPSLLPKYRGASPINRPVINGDKETGISIIEVTSKLDSGDIFAQVHYPLDDRMDAETLSEELAKLSYDLVRDVLKQIENEKLKRIRQNEADATYAEKLTKGEGQMRFQNTATSLSRLIRGLKPWPGTYITFKHEPLHILKAEPLQEDCHEKPGTFVRTDHDQAILVATGQGLLRILKVKPAGKKEMTGADFVRGQHLKPGYNFSSS